MVWGVFMKISSINAEGIIRFLVYILVAGGTASNYRLGNITGFIVILLLFILNSRIRIIFLNKLIDKRLFLLSLFLDIGLVFVLSRSYSLFSYMLLYVTIMDSLILLSIEGYIVTSIVLGFLIYYLKLQTLNVIVLNAFITVSIAVFSIMTRILKDTIKEIEGLYDENRRYSYQLEDSRNMIKEYASKIEELSQFQERNRISREIHDTIGHKLTGVLMQVDAAIRLSERFPEKGNKMFNEVRDNLSKCIDILRQTVRTMAPNDNYSRLLSIEQMISDFRKATAVNIEFNVHGSPLELYPSAEIALYKNAQEAITNAVRHGKADKIEVNLQYGEKQIVLLVKDNGTGCKEVMKGIGISGMEDRVSIVGGSLSYKSEDGFEIKTIIPLRGSTV